MEKIQIDKMAIVLKLLGDKTRLTIILLLKESDCCVCEFVELFDMSQPSISQHVRKLKDANLITETRKGQWIFYSLNKNSEFYETILSITEHLPAQEEKIIQLEKLGKKISCD
ncbi:ArsR family transcriptional regulator [Anaerobacillus alkaliphilus]|uniref:ArsR family transcriptional regulator n=1 Tax=Anaerobacillus alkaliphilus TaxID=1548597 RepID=A0A4Q0VPF4_9BACI|nr:metalloregulator ArsR/SmtB family transcription factor [Anaerobacillus alkaliphilus]RXI98352.1 ArsR family transcriptional regulator [Anaerobacillus alkaliphilus]